MDRDGKHTYHGPGQLMFGTILDLDRRNLKPARLTYILYDILMQLLTDYGLNPTLRNEQRRLGPCIDGSKIGFVDLGLLNGCCYHGMSINIDMDLSQFSRIVPCGVENLKLTQLKDHLANIDLPAIKRKLSELFIQRMGYAMVINLSSG
jgi:lipoyl(octanoyl) transferase